MLFKKSVLFGVLLATLAAPAVCAADDAPAAASGAATSPAPASPAPAPAAAVAIAMPTDPVAKAAFDVLDKHCARCHQIGDKLTARKKPAKGFGNVLMLDKLKGDARLVNPGNPDGSLLFQQIAKGLMPYDVQQEGDVTQPSPTEPEIAALRAWITSLGATTDATCAARKFIDNPAMVDLMEADLKTVIPSRVQNTRYLTLTHFYNACVADDELAVYRAGAVKLLNSLSHSSNLVKLETIDPAKTILRFNIDDLGWSAADWERLVAAYPFAVKPNPRTAPAFDFIATTTYTELPYIRADWFTREASRPPLYNALLGLPDTFPALQHKLGVDLTADIAAQRTKRAGIQNSGVSANNRMIERDQISTGYLWVSYDFSGNRTKQSIFDFPLGPGGEFGFEHNGGEMIFSLPNGMQGYYLAKANGEKLDQGPTNIVLDRNHPEDPVITNGFSCMGCHDAGMKKARDEIRDRDLNDRRFPREARDEIEAIFPKTDEMDHIIEEDAQRFANALTKAGIDPGLRLKKSGAEPINALADDYDGQVDLKLAAAEYGLTKEKFLDAANGNVEALALTRRLAQGNVPRDQFETEFLRFVPILTDDEVIHHNEHVTPYQVAAHVAPDPHVTHSFDLALYTDRSTYALNDSVVITVRSQQDCFLTLIAVDDHDVVNVLLPNKYQQNNAIAANKDFQFPGPGAKFRLTDRGTEKINAVCTVDQRSVDGIVLDYSHGQFAEVQNYSSTLSRAIAVEAASRQKPGISARASVIVSIK